MTSHLPSQLAQLASLLSNPPATASKHLPSLLLQRSIALLQLQDAVQTLSESKEDVSKALEDYLWNVEREMSAEGGGKSSGGAVRASQERLLEALRASVEGFEADWDKGVREFEAWEVKGGGRGWIDGVSRGSGTGADQGSTREEAVSGYLQQLVAEPRTLGSTLAQLSSEDPTLLSTLLPSTTTGKSKAPLEILLRLLENTRGAEGLLEFYIGLWETGIKSLTSPPSPSPSPSPSIDTPPSSTSPSRSTSGEKELCDFLVSSLELLESLALSLPSPPSSSSCTSPGSDPMSTTHPGISAIFLQLFKDLRDLPLPSPVASPMSTRQSSVDRPSVLLGTRSFLGTLSDYSIGGITSVGSGFTSSMDVLGSTLGAGMDSIGLNSISNGIGAVGSGIGALGNGIGSGIRASGTGIASGIGAVGSGIGAVGMGIGAVGAGIGSEIGFGRLGIRRASSDVSIPPTPPLPASTSTPPPTFRPSPSRRASNRTFQPLTTLQLRSSTLLLQSLRPSFPPSSPRSLITLLISHLLQTFPDGEARGKVLLLSVVRYYGFTYLGKRLSRPLSPTSYPRPTLILPSSQSLPPPSKGGMEEKRMFEGTHLSTLEQETMVGIYRLIYGSLVSACGLGIIRGEVEEGEGDERKAWREAGEGFVKGWSQGPTFEVQGGTEDGVKVFKLSAEEFAVLFGSFSNLLLPPFTRPPSFKSTAFRPLSTAYPQDSDEDMGAGVGMRGVLRGIVRGFKDVEGDRADVLCFFEAGEVRLDLTSGSSSIELAGGIGGAGGWISPPRSPRHEDLRTTMTPLPPILSVDRSIRWSDSEVSLLRKGIYSLSKSHFLPSSSSSDDLSTFTTALRSALIRATTNQDFIAQTLYTSLLSLFSTPPSPSQFSALLSSLLHPLLLSRSQHECETSLTMRRLESLDAQLEDLRTRARGERGSIDEGRVRAWYAFLRLSDPMRRLRAKIIDLQSGMEGAGGKGELAEWKKERGIVDFMRGSSELEVGMMWIQRYVSNTIEGDGGGIYASPFWERERRVLEGGEGAVLSFGAASLSLLRNGEEKVMGRSCEDHLERIGMKLTVSTVSSFGLSILANDGQCRDMSGQISLRRYYATGRGTGDCKAVIPGSPNSDPPSPLSPVPRSSLSTRQYLGYLKRTFLAASRRGRSMRRS